MQCDGSFENITLVNDTCIYCWIDGYLQFFFSSVKEFGSYRLCLIMGPHKPLRFSFGPKIQITRQKMTRILQMDAQRWERILQRSDAGQLLQRRLHKQRQQLQKERQIEGATPEPTIAQKKHNREQLLKQWEYDRVEESAQRSMPADSSPYQPSRGCIDAAFDNQPTIKKLHQCSSTIKRLLRQ